MNDGSPPSAPVDAFTGTAEMDRRVIGMGPRGRRWGAGFGLLLAVVVPCASLLSDELGYTLTCTKAERACTVVAERLFESERRRVPFDDISHFSNMLEKHTAQDRGRTVVVGSGRASLAIELKDGTRVYASVPVPVETLRTTEVAEFFRGGGGAVIEVRTTTPLSAFWGVAVVFLAGLLVLSWTRWVTVVELDATSRTVTVENRYWPLVKRTMLRAQIANIRDVVLGTGELHPVRVELADGTSVVIGRFLSALRAAELRDAIATIAVREQKPG